MKMKIVWLYFFIPFILKYNFFKIVLKINLFHASKFLINYICIFSKYFFFVQNINQAQSRYMYSPFVFREWTMNLILEAQ